MDNETLVLSSELSLLYEIFPMLDRSVIEKKVNEQKARNGQITLDELVLHLTLLTPDELNNKGANEEYMISLIPMSEWESDDYQFALQLQKIEEEELNKSLLRDQLLSVREERKRKWSQDTGKSLKEARKLKKGRGGNFSQHEQLKQEREKQHQKWKENNRDQKRVWTLSELKAREMEEMKTTLPRQFSSSITLPPAMTVIGKRALDLTNEFRARYKMGPLQWNTAIEYVASEHSKDMSEGKVAFGHDGFQLRVRKFPFPTRGAGENVAMNNGCGDVAKVAVDGWIGSPGHRKNLLGRFDYCGIGVWRSSSTGAFYLTQMFAYVSL